MNRIFLSHSSADLALTEGAIELLRGIHSWIDPRPELMRARIEAAGDVDRFTRTIASQHRDCDYRIVVLFSSSWKITNAVRLANRLGRIRTRSSVLCEEEWGADPRNTEAFHGFDIERIVFEPLALSKKIFASVERLRASRKDLEQHDFSALEIDDTPIAGDSEEEDTGRDSYDLFMGAGPDSPEPPSFADMLASAGRPDWSPTEMQSTSQPTSPEISATFRRLGQAWKAAKPQDRAQEDLHALRQASTGRPPTDKD